MNRYWIACIISALCLSSCNEATRYFPVHFTEAFPKKARNLELILGKEMNVKSGSDTIKLIVDFNRKTRISSVYRKHRNDTILSGYASRYKGIIFISKQLNDTTYLIHALKLEDQGIKGLFDWGQMLKLEEYVQLEAYNEMIVGYDEGNDHYRLKPDKKLTYKIYKDILLGLKMDTIIETIDENKLALENIPLFEVPDENPESQNIKNVAFYPNPVKDIACLELKDSDDYFVEIIDAGGHVVLKRKLHGPKEQLNLDSLPNGSYILKLYDPEKRFIENIGFLKV